MIRHLIFIRFEVYASHIGVEKLSILRLEIPGILGVELLGFFGFKNKGALRGK